MFYEFLHCTYKKEMRSNRQGSEQGHSLLPQGTTKLDSLFMPCLSFCPF